MGIGPREPKRATFCARHFACTKTFTAELMDVSRLWGLNERKVEEFFFWSLSGVLEVKDGLDRTGMKKIEKNSKNFMHWNVTLDALPGSAKLVCVLDCWLNNY